MMSDEVEFNRDRNESKRIEFAPALFTEDLSTEAVHRYVAALQYMVRAREFRDGTVGRSEFYFGWVIRAAFHAGAEWQSETDANGCLNQDSGDTA